MSLVNPRFACVGIPNVRESIQPSQAWQPAPSCGNKHDSLIRVQKVLANEPNLAVPPFFGFSEDQIQPLYSTQTHALWQQAAAIGKEGLFTKEIQALLNDLQQQVFKDVSTGYLPLTDAQKAFLTAHEGERLIVRSSSDEDATCPNAGGNTSVESVAAEESAIKQALAHVLASYFSFQSLKNRSSFEDPFARMPKSSVLVMVQIVEKNENEPVSSGVMMTHKPLWMPRQEAVMRHIAASWGFGGGVVSGKIPSDEWLLVDDDSYCTIRNKPSRQRDGKEIGNPEALRSEQALSAQQLQELKQAAKLIENEFQQPMDVEFVCKANICYIVQARPIQAPELSSPTFLNPDTLSKGTLSFRCKTILYGKSEVLTLTHNNLLLATSLEEAEKKFDAKLHKAVVVYTAPQSASTHAEVNFDSNKPPIPCLLLPEDGWRTLKETLSNEWETPVNVCPQTGLIVIQNREQAVEKGLFLHPASLSISLPEEREKGLQAPSQDLSLEKIEKLLSATAQVLTIRLDEIEGGLAQLFREITSRTTCIGHFREVALKLQKMTYTLLGAMKESANKEKPTLLAFQASCLRQLLNQSSPQVLGAHTIGGLEAATNLSSRITDFLQTHSHDPILCELALFARKAFDDDLQAKWLAFIDNMEAETKDALLARVKQLDLTNQLPIWFVAYFSKSQSQVEELLVKDPESELFFQRQELFLQDFAHLKERVGSVRTGEDLMAVWDALKQQSKNFLDFLWQWKCKEKQTDIEFLHISSLSYELIQLWDLQIKSVKTSKVLTQIEEERLFRERVKEFGKFGQEFVRRSPKYDLAIYNTIGDALKGSRLFSNPRPFSVEHWLGPRSACAADVPIRTEDQRLTVIHQNLLLACAPPFDALVEYLPATLASAYHLFTKHNPFIAQKFGNDAKTFASIREDRASFTVNIPLNYHSSIMTFEQHKGSNAIHCSAYWKGNDKSQSVCLEFLQAAALLSGFELKNYAIIDEDLKVSFIARNERQQALLSRAIHYANSITLGAVNNLKQLRYFLRSEGYEALSNDEQARENSDIKKRVLEFAWNHFIETERMLWLLEKRLKPFCGNKKEIHKKIANELKSLKLYRRFHARVMDEAEGKRPKTKYFELIGDVVPKERASAMLQRVIEDAYRFESPSKGKLLKNSLGKWFGVRSKENSELQSILQSNLDALSNAELYAKAQISGRLIRKGFAQAQVLLPKDIAETLETINDLLEP